MKRKAIRIFLWFVAVIVLLVGSLFILLQVDSVQTWLAQRAAAYLSDQLKTKVTIGKVSIRFIERVSLKNLYIEDLHHNTLLSADEFQIDIKELSTSARKLEISKVVLSHSRFYLTRYHGETYDNIQFLSDYFSSKDTTTSSVPWKIKLNDIKLEDVAFRHAVEDEVAVTDGVDFAHLDMTNIYGDLKNISFQGDSVFVIISKLKFRDKSGFQLDELSADAKVAPNEMRLNQLIIRTPHTNLITDLTFHYDSMSAFDEFLTNVQFNSDFKNARVSFEDIAYFAPDLKGINQAVGLDGPFKGTVSRFKGKNITISFGEKSYYHGNIAMTGLPDIEETYIEALAEDVQINKKDVENIPIPPFTQQEHVVIPENLAALGNVSFKGKFTGFLSDFVAFGNVKTDIGFISSDLNVKLDRTKNTTVYNGHLSTNQFNLGKIISSDEIGLLTMNADINGSGFRLDNINARLVGNIDALEFRNYTYRGIKVNGEVSKKLFSGSLNIHEPNIDFDFAGTVDFSQSIPDFNFTADIGKAQLDTLNLFRYRGEKVLKTKIISHFSGNKFDNLEGSIELENTDFRFDKVLYHINHFGLSSVRRGAARSVVIQSDNLDATFEGRFELATLGDAFKQILPKYIPAVIVPGKSKASNQDFTFNIHLKNMAVITENFFPSWTVDPNTILIGSFNSIANSIHLDLESSLVTYKNFRFSNMRLKTNAGNEKISMVFNADQFHYSDESYLASPRLQAEALNNRITFRLQLADSVSNPDRADLPGELNFYSPGKFDLHFANPSIVLKNNQWSMDEKNKLLFDSSAIRATDFSFRRGNEQISINGAIAENENEQLVVDFINFNLNNLNPLLESSKVTLGGLLTGKSTVADVYRKVRLVSDMSVEKIQFNGDTLGNAVFVTTFDDSEKMISVQADIQNGAVKIISVNGNYKTDQERDNLNFDVKLNNFYLNTIGKYIEDVVSELNGRVSANLKLRGDFNRPVFTGTVSLNRVRCKVNYLNTRYNFTNDVTIGENYFELKDFQIFDENSHSAIANGRISHRFFSDFNFNVNLDANRFQCLNTVSSQNSIYYGTANASGSAYFSGPIESMNMQIQFTSEKGTQIYIPLTSGSELSQSNFITFRERGKISDFSSLTNRVNLSGIKLDMTLDITPDAEIQIIFDEKIGDKIIGRGYGNLRLDINTIGDFNMFGTYEIQSGSYLFTLQNIINKYFKIEKGSTISWGGNPYDANINLDAVYTTKTSTLYKLLPDSSLRTSLTVDCRLSLSNKLMNPTIKYSINVRNVDAGVQSQINSVLNSEAEVSRQMFGLLVLNQFIPASNTAEASNRIDAGAGASNTGIEFLSDQVNNWLSQISTNVNIGLNYKTRDNYSKEEIKVLFSKSLANDRLLIEGNVGVIGTAAADQNTSSLVGDFNAEWKISPDGKFRVKAFNKSNTSSLVYNYSPYTQGVGVFYREEFNTFRELLERYKLLRKKNDFKNMNQ